MEWTDEQYEVSDAINEVISRMVTVGQTRQEIEARSLPILWAVAKRMTEEAFGTWQTPGILHAQAAVEAAIAAPTVIENVPHIEAMHSIRTHACASQQT